MITNIIKKLVNYNIFHAFQGKDNIKKKAKGKSLFFDKDVEQVFNLIYKKNYWNGKESISGTGSGEQQTQIVRRELNKILQREDVQSILDLPCGDFFWMKKVNLKNINYIGGDIVDEIIERNNTNFASSSLTFKKINIIKDKLPSMDVIFCRDCLVHFSFEDIFSALENISHSGSKYLLTTTFTERDKNEDIITGHWRPLNLLKPPFNFPLPLVLINEECTEQGNFADKCLGVWKIDDLKKQIFKTENYNQT